MKVFTAEQMRAFDKLATERYAIPSIVLMENAALRVVEFLEFKFAPLSNKRIVVLCGKGNNGGDGFALCRHLLATGCHLTVLMGAAPGDLKGDALANYDMLRLALAQTDGEASELRTLPGSGADSLADDELWLEAERADIVIDALLGTGFKGEVRGDRLQLGLTFLHMARGARIAVDLPSGVAGDTGIAASAAGQGERAAADYTVTLAAPKPGLLLRDGLELAGEVWVGAIGTPPIMDETETGCECITREAARSRLPQRPIDAHKGDAGRVLLCGGSYGMSGAPTLAARAALRTGAGLCIACLPDKILPIFAAAFAEATSHPLPCDEQGALVPEAADRLPEHWKNANVVALGPGLSRSAGALDFARAVVTACPHPLIIDADALYALRKIAAKVKARKAPTILTPHPGEMGELMDLKTAEVQADRLGVVRACAKKYNAIVVLKGSRSLVALPDGLTYFNLTGNSGMATGGSGDVLTGAIAGLLAQLKDAVAATLLGVYAHGLAGDCVYAAHGNGLIAGDIAAALPEALRIVATEAVPQVNGRLRQLG